MLEDRTEHVVDVDLADVFDAPRGGRYVATLAWGDPVEVLSRGDDHVQIGFTTFRDVGEEAPVADSGSGFIRSPGAVAERARRRILRLDVVDVQQGDASVLETPGGKVVLLDGGENVLFARYLASRFRNTAPERPLSVDCVVVTHGDADHFAGLTEIRESEADPVARKRLFLQPRRVYHNGLVKRPDAVPEAQRLGPTAVVDGRTVVTGLETDLLAVPEAAMNRPFRAWKRALAGWRERGPIEFRRLAGGDDDAFAFLREEGVKVEVLGPQLVREGGVEGLPFLGEPASARIGHDSVRAESAFRGLSAAHTINGHSIVLRLTYGRWRFLWTGDLNEQSERALLDAHRRRRLSVRAEVLKAPHHGSADFAAEFLAAVAPVVSIVSSGDESARVEHIHPRATLLAALGRHARGLEPLVFVTELVAFFQVAGPARTRAGRWVFAFERTTFGMVKLRTDGERLLVWTNSGQVRLKEAYAYTLEAGRPVPVPVRRV